MKQASRTLLGAPTKETKKRPPLYGHHIEHLHLSDFSRTKLEKIEEIFRTKLKNEVAVHEQIVRIIKVLEAQPERQGMVLDLELESSGEAPQTK